MNRGAPVAGTVLGTGVDLVEIARVEQVVARWGSRFLGRVFTSGELHDGRGAGRPGQHFASRFAVKEAVYKALPPAAQRRTRWQDIEVRRLADGAPEVRLKRVADPGWAVLVSISHCGAYVLASAVVLQRSPRRRSARQR